MRGMIFRGQWRTSVPKGKTVQDTPSLLQQYMVAPCGSTPWFSRYHENSERTVREKSSVAQQGCIFTVLPLSGK